MTADETTPNDLIERRTEKLAGAGYRHLERGEAEAALGVAKELEALRNSAAFEIAAMAHWQLGDRAEAIAVLKRGLALAPSVWLNWQLLGNSLSDLERFEEAAAAYESALQCPGADQSSIRLNQAILALRRGRHDHAWSYAEQVTDEKLALRAAATGVTALAALGRFDEAIHRGEAILGGNRSGEPAELVYLAAAVGRVHMARGATADEIFAFSLGALDAFNRSHRQLLALIRDADNQHSAVAKYFRMTVDAKIPIADPLSEQGRGFIVSYDVVADSIEEALTFVERMESPAVRGNLRVEESEVLEEPSGAPKGVYKRTGRVFYRRGD